MTPEHQLRQLIFKLQPLAREIMITERQVNIIRFAKELGAITSADLAKFYKISIQNASAQLKKLNDKGYLRYRQDYSETGGIINVYRSVL